MAAIFLSLDELTQLDNAKNTVVTKLNTYETVLESDW